MQPDVTSKESSKEAVIDEEITEEKLFSPVPLSVRMASGIDKVQQLSLKQRDNIIKQVAESPVPIPEARFDKITAIGEVNMRFTTAM